jgi:hypothetical protein
MQSTNGFIVYDFWESRKALGAGEAAAVLPLDTLRNGMAVEDGNAKLGSAGWAMQAGVL